MAPGDDRSMLATARTTGVRSVEIALLPPRLLLAACAAMAERAAAGAVEEALTSRQAAALVERIADRLLAQGLAERFIERLLEAPELERLLGVALDSPGMERLVTRAVQSRLTEATMARLVDDAVVRLPQSEALWALVDEVAQSPAVMDAITSQSRGVADDVASDLRDRSRDADDWLERTARRMLRRHGRGGGPAPGMPAPQLP
jgi:hypothetical protein